MNTPRWWARLALVALAIVGLSACNAGNATQPPTDIQRPFTIATTLPPTQLDPAIASLPSDVEYLPNIFQTLMTAQPGGQTLKPDAAKDCIFDSQRVYTCTLKENTVFHNGHQLTSSDVKFSILRALRLDPAGERTSLLASIYRIETPDDLTVRFILREPDSLIGWGLASPAAAIVDEESYDSDRGAAPSVVVGSGPFRVAELNGDRMRLEVHEKYNGPRGAALREPQLIRFFPDSASIEEAMANHQVDAVWQGLSSSALTRLSHQIEANGGRTDSNFVAQQPPQPAGTRLIWSPTSAAGSRSEVRQAVRDILQEDRIADSLVPNDVSGHVKAFHIGGVATPAAPATERIHITLGYDRRTPDHHDLANRLRDRLESTGGFVVRLVDRLNEPADITLERDRAPFATALSWLDSYLSHPGVESVVPVFLNLDRYRAMPDPSSAQEALRQLQLLAAYDATVVPVSFDQTPIFIGDHFHHHDTAYGPNGQLGLWGFTR